MASRRRNIKTHPNEDPEAGGFVSPERTDLTMQSLEQPVTIDLHADSEEVDLSPKGETKGTAREEGVVLPETTLQGNDEPVGRPQRADRQRADQGEGDGRYSHRVEKRVRRERNLLNRERNLREETQRQLGEEQTARQALEERLARVERRQTDIASNADVKGLETKLAGLKDKLFAAKEAGDTRLEMDLTIQLADVQSDLKLLRFKLEQAAADAETADHQRRTQKQQQGTEGAGNALTAEEIAAARDWQKENRHWFARPSFRDAKADAIAIDQEIVQGVRTGELDFDLYGDEHFEELARRLQATHPELPVVDLEGRDYDFTDDEDDDMRDDERDTRGRRDTRDDGRGDRRNGGRQLNARGERVNNNDRGRNTGGRSPAGGIGQGGRRQVTEVDLARQGKVTLAQGDFNTMRVYGLDPNNADHKRAFAKERARTILTEDARGTR